MSTLWRLVPDTQANTHDGQRQAPRNRPDIRAQLTGFPQRRSAVHNGTRRCLDNCKVPVGAMSYRFTPPAADGVSTPFTAGVAGCQLIVFRHVTENVLCQEVAAERRARKKQRQATDPISLPLTGQAGASPVRHPGQPIDTTQNGGAAGPTSVAIPGPST